MPSENKLLIYFLDTSFNTSVSLKKLNKPVLGSIKIIPLLARFMHNAHILTSVRISGLLSTLAQEQFKSDQWVFLTYTEHANIADPTCKCIRSVHPSKEGTKAA